MVNVLEMEKSFNKKEYHKKYNKEWYIKNKEHVKDTGKQWRENNQEKIKKRWKEYAKRPEVIQMRREYNQRPDQIEKRKAWAKTPKGKESRRLYNQRPEIKKINNALKRIYYQNPEEKERRRKYAIKNSEKIKERMEAYLKEYYQKPQVRKRRNEYRKERRDNDKSYHNITKLRRRLLHVFERYSMKGKETTSKLYGINWNEIIEHLKPFPKDIENYQIDHIIPLSKFDFNNAKHIKIAFAPENHQWLTIEENLSKNNKLIMLHSSLGGKKQL